MSDAYLLFQKKVYNVLLIGFYILIIFLTIALTAKIIKNKSNFYIEQKEISLSAGEYQQLILKVNRKTYHNDGSVYWSSSDNDIAVVNQDGIVTGVKKGTAEITVRSNEGQIAMAYIEVYGDNPTPTPEPQPQPQPQPQPNPNPEPQPQPQPNNNIEVQNIFISGNNSVFVGESLVLSAVISPNNATNKNISWSSSNNNIATVNNGVVKAISTGKVTITAKSNNGKQATIQITITNKPANKTSIILDKSQVNLYVNGTTTLTARIIPDNSTAKNVTWSSSNSAVATVDKNGKVKATKIGSATITAKTTNGSSATCLINVVSNNVDVTGISISNPYINLVVDGQTTINATVLPSNATNKTITWSSSDSNIVSVDSKGNIKANAEGIATITAKSNNGKVAYSTVKTYRNRIYFLDTQSQTYPYYHNDAILLESNGKFAMIDVSQRTESCQKIDNYLNSIGVKKLDFIIITHWHNDHYECNGWFRDGQGIETDKFYVKNIDATYKTNLVSNAQVDYEHLKQNGGNRVILLKDNINIEFGDYTLELKNMTNRVQILKDNNLCNSGHAPCDENVNSIVIKGTERNSGKTFYLAGDMQGYRDSNGSILYNWEYDLARSIGNVDIYKVSHHGHGVSNLTFNNSQDTINALRPKYSILTSARTSDNATGIISTVQNLKNIGSKVYFSGCGTVVMTFPSNPAGNIGVIQLENIDKTGNDACFDSGGVLTPKP